MCNRSFFSFFILLHFLILDRILYYCVHKVKWLTDFTLFIYQTIITDLLFSFLKACCSVTFHLLFYPYNCAPSFKHTCQHTCTPSPITTTTHTHTHTHTRTQRQAETEQGRFYNWPENLMCYTLILRQNRHRWHVSPMLHNGQAGRQRDRTGR